MMATANVPPVIGTGVQLSGMEIWANSAMNSTPPTTSATLTSVVERGSTASRSGFDRGTLIEGVDMEPLLP
jgi:hypothetical protein